MKERARLQEEEERRKKEEELRLQREEEQRKAELRQQQKSVLKKWRQALRHLCNEICRELVVAEDLQELCLAHDAEQLEQLCLEILTKIGRRSPKVSNGSSETESSKLLGPPCILALNCAELALSNQASEEVANLLNGRIAEVMDRKAKDEAAKTDNAEKRRAEEKRQRDEAKRLAKLSNEWTSDEMSLLAKALQKFPGGTAGRWQQIASFIGTRSPDEVVEKAKEMAEGSSLKLMGSKLSSVAFDNFKNHNHGAFKKIEVDPDKRDDGAAETRNSSENSKQRDAAGNGTANKEVKKDECQRSITTESEWTAEQQTAFEKALASYPSSIPSNERWTSIANCVPGKSRKDCIARFKEIRQAILSKKGSS